MGGEVVEGDERKAKEGHWRRAEKGDKVVEERDWERLKMRTGVGLKRGGAGGRSWEEG